MGDINTFVCLFVLLFVLIWLLFIYLFSSTADVDQYLIIYLFTNDGAESIKNLHACEQNVTRANQPTNRQMKI